MQILSGIFLLCFLQIGILHDKCPDTSQMRLMSKAKCNLTYSYYVCFFDENSKTYKASCSKHYEIQSQGYKTVIRGSIDRQECAPARYQPFTHISDYGPECVFEKSTCLQEGQVKFDSGTTTKDISCRCDNSKGYAFLVPPSAECICFPSYEDCTCYKKLCSNNTFLTPDYHCVSKTNNSGNVNCSVLFIQKKQHTNDEFTASVDIYKSEIHRVLNVWIIALLCILAYAVLITYVALHMYSQGRNNKRLPEITVSASTQEDDYETPDRTNSDTALTVDIGVKSDLKKSDGTTNVISKTQPEFDGRGVTNTSLTKSSDKGLPEITVSTSAREDDYETPDSTNSDTALTINRGVKYELRKSDGTTDVTSKTQPEFDGRGVKRCY